MRTDENTLIRYVAERLVTRHPDLPPARIADMVHHAHARFDGVKVRDFVPLLVERRVTNELATMHG
ncbi:three-helix bundle dimerization domain-containing protein [Nocardia pseudobrasiliensis]|nr:hypothetical protein [Nocardia pseudobrasiliensis]